MSKQVISTIQAPQAIGPYSQAVWAGDLLFISGQIAMSPETGEIVSSGFDAQAKQMFANLRAICEAAGGTLDDIIKINLYLTDLANFSAINNMMAELFTTPYPARAAVQVSALPKQALVEAEAVMCVTKK